MLRGGRQEPWCQPEEELASQEETSYNSVSLSDHLAGQTGERVLWWARLCFFLNQGCLGYVTLLSSI